MSAWQSGAVADTAAPIRNALVGGPFGSDLTSRDYVQFGIPVIRGTNLNTGRWVGGDFVYVTEEKANSLSANCAAPGDLVFTQRGTLGQVALVPVGNPQRYLISQSQMKLTVDPSKADPRFIYYVFFSEEMRSYIRQHAIQTGVPHINLGILRETPIPLPPLKEQHSIAVTLGALDDKIESNRRAQHLTLEVASAMYRAACVQSECRVPLGDVAEFHNRRRIPLSSQEREQRVGPYPYYGATGVFGYVDDYLFDEVLVLVGEDGSVVNDDGTPVTQYIWGKAWINNHAHPLKGKGISNELLLLALRASDVRPIVTGAVQPKISMGNLRGLELVLPSNDATASLASEFDVLFSVYRQRADETASLTTLRDTLLPELLSGRIRVPEAAEAIAERVA